MIDIKTPEEIQIMQKGGKILAKILRELTKRVKAGIKTEELDKLAEKLTRKYNAKPSFKGYQGYPKALCVCINEELVHCLPSKRIIKEGDIVSLDYGIWYKGLCVDSAVTIGVGKISPEARKIIKVTKRALYLGIKRVKAGVHLGDIGFVIQKYVESQGYSVVRDLSGHGVGKEVHEPPQILHYGKPKTGIKLKENMTICIEPMVCLGSHKIKQRKDGSFVTADKSLSAHFEHTILVTRKGYRILT